MKVFSTTTFWPFVLLDFWPIAYPHSTRIRQLVPTMPAQHHRWCKHTDSRVYNHIDIKTVTSSELHTTSCRRLEMSPLPDQGASSHDHFNLWTLHRLQIQTVTSVSTVTQDCIRCLGQKPKGQKDESHLLSNRRTTHITTEDHEAKDSSLKTTACDPHWRRQPRHISRLGLPADPARHNPRQRHRARETLGGCFPQIRKVPAQR